MKITSRLITFTFVPCLLLIFSCATPAEQLKEDNPTLFNEIAGKWYVLSSDDPTKFLGTFTLNDDGTINDPERFVIRWNYSASEFFWSSSQKGGFDVLYTYPKGKTEITRKVFYTINSNDKSKIHPIFHNYISKIGFIPKEYQYPGKILIHDESILESIKQDINQTQNNELDIWNNTNKNSIKEVVEFIKTAKNEKSRIIATETLHNLLDSKTKAYILKYNKKYSKYSDSNIINEDGMPYCKLYEFIRINVVAINPASGTKLSYKIVDNTNYKDGFDLIGSDGSVEYICSFKPYKNNIVIMNMSMNSDSRGWPYKFQLLVNTFNAYPDINNIDIDLIDKL